MRLTALVAFGIAFFCASPSFAGCVVNGQPAVEGGRLCQAGVISVCSSGAWLSTTLTCPLQPGSATQALVSSAQARIHVLEARYRAGDTGTDFVFALRSQCDGKVTCSLSGDTSLLQGDPAPRLRGTFNVLYACTTGFATTDSKQAVFAKGTPQTLSCSE
jgi:hypothetical protein